MKILIVTQYFWPESFVINSLSVELVRRGHSVTVFTGLPNYPQGRFFDGYGLFKGPWQENHNGVKVVRIPMFARGGTLLSLVLNYISFAFIGSIFALFKFRKKEFDVVFCFGLSPITLCIPAVAIKKTKSIPLVLWVQDLWPESVKAVGVIKSKLLLDYIAGVVSFIYKNCDLILTQSKSFKHSIIDRGGGAECIHYIPNWADPFGEIVKPDWVKNLPEGFKVGFAGNIGKAQDIETLLRAAELLKDNKDIKWIVAGDGSEKPALEAAISKRGLASSVITVGKKSYEEMKPFFEACDILYVSLKDEYIFSLTIPSKVQAYMSAARPLVCCLNGEGADVIKEAMCGLVANSEDYHTLAKNILKIKSLPIDERLKMGENGKTFFEKNFARAAVVSNIEMLLGEVVKS